MQIKTKRANNHTEHNDRKREYNLQLNHIYLPHSIIDKAVYIIFMGFIIYVEIEKPNI